MGAASRRSRPAGSPFPVADSPPATGAAPVAISRSIHRIYAMMSGTAATGEILSAHGDAGPSGVKRA